MAREISALKPFESSPSREPVIFEQRVKELYKDVTLNDYKVLITKKKKLYRDYRTP